MAGEQQQQKLQMQQAAATGTVQQQWPAGGERLLARQGWATQEAGVPGAAAAAAAAMPPQRLQQQQQRQVYVPLPFAHSGNSRPQSLASLFSPLVCLAASPPLEAPLPLSSAPSADVWKGSQLRPGTALPCSLPTNVPPLIAAMLTARGQRAAAASPRRPATAPPKRQQQPARPATTGAAAAAPGQQQLVTRLSLAGQQRGAGAGAQPLEVRGAVATDSSAGAAAQRGPAWGR
jgi:hypothetical protein